MLAASDPADIRSYVRTNHNKVLFRIGDSNTTNTDNSVPLNTHLRRRAFPDSGSDYILYYRCRPNKTAYPRIPLATYMFAQMAVPYHLRRHWRYVLQYHGDQF